MINKNGSMGNRFFCFVHSFCLHAFSASPSIFGEAKNSMRIGCSACQTIVWVLLHRMMTVNGESWIYRTTGR